MNLKIVALSETQATSTPIFSCLFSNTIKSNYWWVSPLAQHQIPSDPKMANSFCHFLWCLHGQDSFQSVMGLASGWTLGSNLEITTHSLDCILLCLEWWALWDWWFVPCDEAGARCAELLLLAPEGLTASCDPPAMVETPPYFNWSECPTPPIPDDWTMDPPVILEGPPNWWLAIAAEPRPGTSLKMLSLLICD